MTTRSLPLLLLAATLAACGDRASSPARAPAPPGTTRDSAGNLVDRTLLPQDALRAFREGLPEVTALEGGSPTREALVRRFMTALETRDTADLRRMVLSRAEFAWLWYETDPQSQPPYSLEPELYWFTLSGRSEQDVSKALDELGGRPTGYLRHECAEPRMQGENRVYGYCRVYRAVGADTLQQALFGLIVERGGSFKFVMYNNRL